MREYPKDICKYYPKEKDDCVCACGSDISGKFLCTAEYAQQCQWAKERYKRDTQENNRKIIE